MWATTMLAASIPAIVVFILYERRTKERGHDPLVDLTLFELVGYRRGLFVVAAYFLGAGSLFLVLSLFEQSGLGRDPMRAAVSFVPSGIATFVASWLATRHAERKPALFLYGGLTCVLMGLFVIVAALAGLEATARKQVKELPTTAVATLQRLSDPRGPGLAAVAQYERDHARYTAQRAMAEKSTCSTADIDEKFKTAVASMQAFRAGR